MSRPMVRLPRASARWVTLSVATAFALAVGAGLSGCGNVADVGVGASQSSVQPVSGPYTYGTSTTSAAQLQERDRQVSTAAEANKRSDSKAAVAVNKAIKAEADSAEGAAPEVTPESAEPMEPALKATIITQEQGLSTQPAPTGSGGYGPGY